MKKAIVIGSFGCGNKGDDAILDGLNAVIGKKYKLVPTSGNYGGLEKILDYNCDIIPLRLNEGISLNILVSVCGFLIKYIRELQNADCLIVGGGSLIHDITVYNLPFYKIICTIAKVMKTPIFFIGVGAGPLNTKRGRKLAANILKNADKVIIREKADYNLLSEIGVNNHILSVDNAFAGNIDNVSSKDLLSENSLSPKKYVIVTACQWFKSDNFWKKESMDFSTEKEIFVKSILSAHDALDMQFVFLPTVMHDKQLGMEIESSIGEQWFHCLSDNYSCREMAAIIAESYMVYGMRMHSLILAIRAGVPFVASLYDDKVRHLIQRLGMDKYMLEFDELKTEKIIDTFNSLISNYDVISDTLCKCANEYKNICVANINKVFTE